MLISVATIIVLFIEASWAATIPTSFDALRQTRIKDIAALIENHLEELLEMFEVEWDSVIKEFDSVPLSVEYSPTQSGGSGNTTRTTKIETALSETPFKGASPAKTNGVTVEVSVFDKTLNGKSPGAYGRLRGLHWLPVGSSTGVGNRFNNSESIIAMVNNVTNSIDIHEITDNKDPRTVWKAKERLVRQAPPNAIYRRQQSSRPCRNRDGSSAVFAGSNAMSYISFLANVMALVLNINNNVNNNNNNNNINSNNNIDNNNANLNVNSNNVNQINIMPPGGRRRRRQAFDPEKSLVTNSSCQVSTKGMVELVLETTMKEAWGSIVSKAHTA